MKIWASTFGFKWVNVWPLQHGDRIAGYIALYLIGWSPALWTVGYMLLTGGGGGAAEGAGAGASGGGGGGGGGGGSEASFKEKLAGFGQTCKFIVKEIVNPPLVGLYKLNYI